MSALQSVFGLTESLASSASSVPVTLGGVTLLGVEVPSVLRLAQEQSLAVTNLPGGARVIQAMGTVPASITLAGVFIGAQAQTRALLFSRMRDAAKIVTFAAANVSIQVAIRAFSYDITAKSAVLPYQLTLEVMPSAANATYSTAASQWAQVYGDVNNAISIAGNAVATASGIITSFGGNPKALNGITSAIGIVSQAGTVMGAAGALLAASPLAGAVTATTATIAGLQTSATGLVQALG